MLLSGFPGVNYEQTVMDLIDECSPDNSDLFDLCYAENLLNFAGLPAADGEVLAKDVALKGYIRDRAPEVRFPGRAYVLPASGDQRLSMVTVNADRVDLRLLRISDRNLIRTMSESMFAVPLDSWQAEYFSDQMAREIWKGSAEVARPMGQDAINRELTTSLAIPAEARDHLLAMTPASYVGKAAELARRI